MKSILSTWALFLVLPWKLTGETTLRPSSTRQHEDTSKNHETTIRGDEPTVFSPKNNEIPLKPNGETTHSPSSTRLLKGTSKDDETTTRGDKLTIFVLQNQDEYTMKESENVFSTRLLPQTSEHQHVTSMSHAEYLAHTMTLSTGESKSSSHLPSLPFLTKLPQKKTNQITITPLTQNMSEEIITTRDHQTLHNFKSTNKGLDRYTQGNKTTRSAEKESFKSETDISTQFQKVPEVITKSGVEVQTIETLTTKMSSLHQEKETTHPPVLSITDSNGTLGISNEERNDTAAYPLNTTTTGLNPTVNTEVGTTGTTDIMDMETTYERTTKHMIRVVKFSPSNSETTPTTQTDTTKTTTPKSSKDKKERHPGHIVASLIGSILFLMFVGFVVVFIRNHQMKKKQMEYSDWAGPSPFIEADIHPNLQTINEDGSFHRQGSNRISLHSFLPQQLSKRLSMLSSMNEEVPLEDTQASSTSGECNVKPLNGKATLTQVQTHEAYNPVAESSSDSTIPETVSILPAPENNENIQTPPKIDDDDIPCPPVEINNATPAPFEDVELNLSLDKNTESTSLSDAINIPSPTPS